MPIYEYRCSTCDEIVGVFVKNSDEKPVCPKCGRPLTDRVLSACNAVVGGGGGGDESAACPTGSCCPDGICNIK